MDNGQTTVTFQHFMLSEPDYLERPGLHSADNGFMLRVIQFSYNNVTNL